MSETDEIAGPPELREELDPHPLAYGYDGQRLQVPASATGWRVEKLRGRSAVRGELAYHPDGAPLILQMDCETWDLVANGCSAGRYRLVATDNNGANVGGCIAFCRISDEMEAEWKKKEAARKQADETSAPAAPAHSVDSQNTILVKALADVAIKLADANAALMAAVTGRMAPTAQTVQTSIVEPPKAEPKGDLDGDINGKFVLAQLIEMVKPMMPIIGTVVAAKLSAPTAPVEKNGVHKEGEN